MALQRGFLSGVLVGLVFGVAISQQVYKRWFVPSLVCNNDPQVAGQYGHDKVFNTSGCAPIYVPIPANEFLKPAVVQANLVTGPARSFYMPLKNVGFTYDMPDSATVHYYDPTGSVQKELIGYMQKHSQTKPDAAKAPISRFVAHSSPLRCSSQTQGRTVHLNVCKNTNCYLHNFGHLHINVIELLVDAFRQVYPDILDAGSRKNITFTGFLYGMKSHDEGKHSTRRTPAYLFDVLERIFDKTVYVGVDAIPQINNAHVHCYDQMLYLVENWSARTYVLQGRFGRRQYYRGFGLMMKSFVLSQYGLTLGGTVGDESQSLIKAIWLHRHSGGQGSSRTDDPDTTKIKKIFTAAGFDFTLLTAADFQWVRQTQLRGQRVTRLLKLLQMADVAIGVWGANLWNALYLKAGAILVELKVSMGYWQNENGRSLANMMNLHLHMSDVRNYQGCTKRDCVSDGLRYPEWYLRRLAKEITEAHQIHHTAAYYKPNGNKSRSSNQEDVDEAMNAWSGECVFHWPASKAPLLPDTNVSILTSANQSRCYVDQTAVGWYQRLQTQFVCSVQATKGCIDGSSWNKLQQQWVTRTYPCLAGEPCPGCPWLC